MRDYRVPGATIDNIEYLVEKHSGVCLHAPGSNLRGFNPVCA